MASQVNKSYFVKVWAQNNAGDASEEVFSPTLFVEEKEITVGGEAGTDKEVGAMLCWPESALFIDAPGRLSGGRDEPL